MIAEFKNEAALDFGLESNRKKQLQALELVRSRLGREYDLIIGGESLKEDESQQLDLPVTRLAGKEENHDIEILTTQAAQHRPGSPDTRMAANLGKHRVVLKKLENLRTIAAQKGIRRMRKNVFISQERQRAIVHHLDASLLQDLLCRFPNLLDLTFRKGP
jgi:hypothetical protein